VALLTLFRERLGDTVTSFELIAGPVIDLVLRYLPGARLPLDAPAPWYVLVEAGWSFTDGLAARLEQALDAALKQGLVSNGAIAASEAQRKALWALRDNITEAQAREGTVLRHDVAVPVSQVPALIARGAEQFAASLPGARIMPFGHLGDGNIHYNLLPGDGMSNEAFLALKEPVQRQVFDLVAALGGTISAEHGIGRLKRAELAARKSAVELSLMRQLKQSLDPKGILNPGVIV
jgi:FAD/FMN-containing dehydrogenase